MAKSFDDSFDSFDATISQLTPDEFLKLQNDISFDLDLELTQSKEPIQRFPEIPKAGVDDIAGLRQEKGTVKQTKWGVKIFKGKI